MYRGSASPSPFSLSTILLTSGALFLAASSFPSSSSSVYALTENEEMVLSPNDATASSSFSLRGAFALAGGNDEDGDKSWLWGGETKEEDKTGYMFYQNFDIKGDATRAR